MKKLFFLMIFGILFSACDEAAVSNDNNATTSESTTKAPSKTTEPKESEELSDEKIESLGKTLEYDEFNTKIKQAVSEKNEWANAPLSIVLKYTGAGMDSNVKSIRSKKIGPGENIENVSVTVVEDGLMDDSVKGSISFLRLKKVEGIWQIYKATRAWKCWKGRGHETYSGEPCG